jgi:hypothetical protein
METSNMFECETCFYLGQAKDFIPVTASANLDVLECPNCLNNDKDTFREVHIEDKLAA